MYVCLCKAITDAQIVESINHGHDDLDKIEQHLGAGSGCGCCRETTQSIIDQALAEERSYAA